jgi:hypothetical protein
VRTLNDVAARPFALGFHDRLKVYPYSRARTLRTCTDTLAKTRPVEDLTILPVTILPVTIKSNRHEALPVLAFALVVVNLEILKG